MSSTISQSQVTQFRNRTISQLVQQLNSLGSTAMTMYQTSLLGILDQESEHVRRFRSRSQSKNDNQFNNNANRRNNRESRVSKGGDSRQSKNNCTEYAQFFLTQASTKKYYYHEIINELQVINIAKVMSMFEQGFNTTLIMQFNAQRFRQILNLIQPWIQSSQNNKQFYASFVQYRNKQAIDLLSSRMARTMTLTQACQKDNTIYESTISQLLNLPLSKCQYARILKITKQNTTNPQLSLILLPAQFFLPNSSIADPSLTLLKSQLVQILTYLKSNPNKKYQSINKLLPKRYPTTTAIAQLILYNTVNWVINWVADAGQSQRDMGKQREKDGGNIKEVINGRFQFYTKLLGFCTLVKKVQQVSDNKIIKNIIKKTNNNNAKSVSKFKKQKQQSISQTELNRLNQNNQHYDTKAKFQNTEARSTNQLQYCRSLQRKTHKYSIAQFTSPIPSPQHEVQHNEQYSSTLFPQTAHIDNNNNYNRDLPSQLTQTQTIAILKAQHARQISQYHQTIQNLNQKILILTSEKGQNISQIFKIYQRQIMLLQLKIKQLRGDISKICATNNGSKINEGITKQGTKGNININKDGKQIQGLKQIIKRLNQQIIAEKKNYNHGGKISQGKIKLMQVQIKQWKDKYQKSEIARKQLKIQLQASTNRIKLKDEQTKSLHEIQSKTYNHEDLSSKQSAILNQLQNYLQRSITGIPSEPASYILRKFKNVLGTVSELREIIMECHNFLADLQQHIQNKLGDKDPETVLDCNRFIRGFVIGNLDIF